jgi:predicted permease
VILAEGYIMKPGESVISPFHVSITPGYCEAMKIPLIEGRFFDRSDTQDSRRVIIVDRRLAHKFWPNSSPLGKRMWRPRSPETLTRPDKDVDWLTVVGVIESVKQRGLVDPDERLGAVYFPYAQQTDSGITFVMRTAAAPYTLTGAARRAITDLDRQLPLFDVHTMEERMDESLVNRRSPMWLALSFAAVALLLACVGIYGVLAYLVSQRTKEIGIRLALGSGAGRVFKLILKEGLLILTVGFGLGMAGALALGRYLESILYGVRPMDPIVIAFVTMVLGATAIAACVLPAQQATRVDPIIALRQE